MVTSSCLNGVKLLSQTEHRLLSGFGAAGSILITVYGLAYLLWFIWRRLHPKRGINFRERACSAFSRDAGYSWLTVVLVLIVLALTVPQVWGVLRLRNIQKALAISTNNVYVDNQWTFGQVVAVVLFAPVFTEVGYLWIE